MHVRLGGLSIRAAGSWETVRDAPADGIVVGVDGRFEDVLAFFPAAAQDGWSAEGSLEAELRLRGGRDLTSISGDVRRAVDVARGAGTRARGASRASRANSRRRDARDSGPGATAFDPNAVDGTIVATTGSHLGRAVVDCAAGANHVCDWRRAGCRSKHSTGSCLRARSPPPGRIGLGPAQRQRRACRRRHVARGSSMRSCPDAATAVRPSTSTIAGPIDGLRYEGTIELDDASLVLPEGRFAVAGWSGRLVGQRRRRRVRASRPGQRRRRVARRDGDPARQRAGASADHHREARVPGDSSRAQERARCRSDLEQRERARAAVGHGDDLGRRVPGARQQPWCAWCRR